MTKAAKMNKEVVQVQTNEVNIPEEIVTVSGKIRYLTSIGMKRGEVAKMLNIRYQHVRNVLVTPLKKA